MIIKKVFALAACSTFASVLAVAYFTPTAEQLRKAKIDKIEAAAKVHMKSFEETVNSGSF